MDETELTQDEVNDLPGDERTPDGTRTTSTSGSGERARGPATVTVKAAPG
jgi:hypothetical protein